MLPEWVSQGVTVSNSKSFVTSLRDIIGIDDQQREEVYVPEWNAWFLVQSLTGAERDAFEASIVEGRGRKRDVNIRNLRAKLIVRSVVTPDGGRVFSDADVEALGAKNAAALDRLFSVAQRLSGLSDNDVEDLAGNSEGGQSGGLTSGGLSQPDEHPANS